MANGRKKFPQTRLVNLLKGIGVYVLVGLAALLFFTNLSGGTSGGGDQVPISKIVTDIKDGKVDKLELENERIVVFYKGDNKQVISRKEAGESIYKILESSGVDP